MVYKNQFYIATSPIDDVILDIENSVESGINWGNSVVIALTASLLAISLIAFLFNRSN